MENLSVKIVKMNQMTIAGFSVETTLENSTDDVGTLYNDFINNGKMEMLSNITKNKVEYYGVIWYTKLHEKYKYLVGQKVNEKPDMNSIEIKIIPEGEYCCKKFPQKYDTIKAWTQIYFTDIPEIGYKPIEKNDMALEYYPNGFDGEYELWVLAEKA